MFLVYLIAMMGPGAWVTDWTNDNLFGDGFHLLGIGSADYEEKAGEYEDAANAVSAYYELDTEAEDFIADAALAEMKELTGEESAVIAIEDEETLEMIEKTVYYESVPDGADKEETVGVSYKEAVAYFEENGFEEPDPAEYGVFVPGIPAMVESGLDAVGAADWLKCLILKGIVAGVGAGCGVPGIMASRTIENERDRRMTIITTTFIPCGAKAPFIAMIAGAGCCIHRRNRLLLPRIHPALRTVLCSDRRDQARNEQRKMDMVCNSLSVRICVCDLADDQSVRRLVHG